MILGTILRKLPLQVAIIALAFFAVDQAHAQRGRLVIADYSVSAAATQLTIDGVAVNAQPAAGELPRIQLLSTQLKRIQLLRASDGSVLASTTLMPDFNLDYLLLASGDGQTLPYKLQVDASVGVRTRLFNASRLLGEAPELEVLMESDDGSPAVRAAAGSLSESLAADRANLGLRFRRASDGATLLHLKRADFGRSGLARDVLVVLHGTQNELKADEIGISDFNPYVVESLPSLALGTVQVKLLNGGALGSGPAPMDFDIGGQSARLEYGQFSSTITLPEQGSYELCAEAFRGITQFPLISCGTLEFEGGKRYLAISRSFYPNQSNPSPALLDALPFLAYETPDVAGNNSRVRVLYGAVAPRFIEFLYVGADAGGEPQVLDSPGIAQPAFGSGAVTLLDGAPERLDIKISGDYGTRNLADLAPFTPAPGSAVDAVLIGDGERFPYRIVSDAALAEELVVDSRYGGFWTIDEFALEGFNLTPMPEQDRLLGTWFKHGSDDRPQWFVMDSCASEPGSAECLAPAAFQSRTVVLRVYQTDKPGSVRTLRDAGTLRIQFSDCIAAVATVDLLGQASQTLHLSNQTPTAECKLAQLFPSGGG
ncbi:MAG: hypothetical protein AB7E72_02025 [Lysobacterales bacterium]